MSRARWLKRVVLAGATVGGGGLMALWALPTMQERRKNQVSNHGELPYSLLLTCDGNQLKMTYLKEIYVHLK